MSLSHSIPDHRFPADAQRERRPLTFAPPRERSAAASSFAAAAKIPQPVRRRGRIGVERYGIFTLVAAAHIAGAVGLARFRSTPPEPPQKPITVSLITPPAVVPAPVPLPEPPQPEVRQEPPPKPVVKPRPPKPAVKTAPPKPKPVPVPAPVVESPTALSSDAAAPEPAPVEPPPPAAPTAPAAARAPAVTAARFDAAYLNNPPPSYPPLSRRMHEEGKVMLRVFVTADGAAGKIVLADSSGSSRLDSAAQKAVASWRFVPAQQDGRNIEAWVVVPIVFKLEG